MVKEEQEALLRPQKLMTLYCEKCKVKEGENREWRGRKKLERTHYLSAL